MSITLRSSSSAAGQTGSTFSVTAPTGIQNGDLIFIVQMNGNASNPTRPTGFSQASSVGMGSIGTTANLNIYYRVASSEPGIYTINNVNSLDLSNVWILCFIGAVTAGSGGTTNSATSGTTLTANGRTTTSNGNLVLCGFADLTNQTITPGGGLTDIGSIGAGLLGSLDCAYFIQSSAGATGNQTATVSGTAPWGTFLDTWAPASVTPDWLPIPKILQDAWQELESFPKKITSWLGIQKSFVDVSWFHRLFTEVQDSIIENPKNRGWLFKAPIPNIDKIPWRRKLVYASEPEVESYSRSKTLLPLPLQSQILTSQEGVYGIYNTILLPAQVGIYRIANDIQGYNLYLGSGGLPDLTAPPAAFSKTLPFQVALTPPISGTLIYYVLVRTQDQYGLISQNSYYQTITIDQFGGLFMPPDSPPQDLQLFNEAGGYVHILASYPGINYDQFPATHWQIFAGTIPPNPTTDIPVATIAVSGGILAYDVGPYSPGTIYIAITLWRSTDGKQTASISGSIIIPTVPPEVVSIPSGYDVQP